jgi:hypothetical protein
MQVKSEQRMEYLWANSGDGSHSVSRKLTYMERMYFLCNERFYGQSCPFIGATISLQHQDPASGLYSFNFLELQNRAVEAFCQTRWMYPTVAARVVDGDKALYNIESKVDVKKWAERTVSTISQDGGWLLLRNRLSRDSSMPSMDGDYCLVYLLIRPDEAARPGLTTFDVLMHMHHVFADGSGIRSILNEFLSRLASPLDSEEYIWGQEVERLLPPCILLEKEDEQEAANGESTLLAPNENIRGLFEVCVQEITIVIHVQLIDDFPFAEAGHWTPCLSTRHSCSNA